MGWWRFDEGSGTIASDSSGNGNNGTLQGSPFPNWVTGKYYDALSFDSATAQTQDVNIGNPSSLHFNAAGQQTVALWAYVRGVGTNDGQIIKKQTGWGAGGSGYALDVRPSDMTLQVTNIAGGSALNSGYALSLNTWIFIVWVYNNQDNQLFVNGVKIAEGTSGTFASDSTAAIYINNQDSGSTYGINGIIDEAQIYNRTLSAVEIQADFQQAPDFSPYLLASMPQGTTQVITTLSWQGTGNINVMITTPSQTYTESMMSKYQKTTYSTTGSGPLSMLNIKRLSISVPALSSAQSWNITLTYDNTVSAYQISVETQ